MKKHLFLLAGLLAAFAFTSCSDEENDAPKYELKVLTFENEDYKAGTYTLDYCGKTISTWSDLIAEDQMGGTLLNGTNQYPALSNASYKWSDEGNTLLTHAFVTGPYGTGFSSGGHAVSHYCETDLAKGDYMHQLSVYGKGGHNGSKNFCIHYGYQDNLTSDEPLDLPALRFEDGIERVVDHMWVTSTTYGVNCYNNGNAFCKPIGEGGYVKIIVKGFGANNEFRGKLEFTLAEGADKRITDWTKWDLSSLGKVAMIEFNIDSNDKGDYGLNQPAYFAYDDVAVRFEK